MGDDSYIKSLESQLASVEIDKEAKEKVIESFLAVDENRNGYLEKDEVRAAFEAVGKAPAQYKVRDAITKLDTNHDERLSPAEFAKLYGELCGDIVAEGFKVAVKAKKDIVTRGGHSTVEGTQHSYSPEELVAFCNWINQNLKNDKDLVSHNLPIDPDDEEKFLNSLQDGIILCKLINLSQKDTIDERAINKYKGTNQAVKVHKDQENLNLALNSASAIGCSIVNIGANDIKEKKTHLVLGLLWQVIRIGLFAAINLSRIPALAVLLQEGETIDDLMNLPPEQLLLRWVNYHLAKSPKYQGKPITNFSGDIKDSYAYLCLLEQIQPQPEDEDFQDNMISVDLNKYPGNDKDAMVKRAAYMLNQADKIKCRAFVTEFDVAKGNSKLNLAFVANLFNTYPALEEVEALPPIEETREIKTYRNWMNSLGAKPRVYRFANDLKDGLVLAQLLELVKPGIFGKKKINQPPFTHGGNMKKIENCNNCIIAANELKYSLVGIGGSDIKDGDEKALQSLSWQLMRGYTLGVLEELSEKGAGTTDKDIVEWANNILVEKKNYSEGDKITSLRDPKISSSIPVLDLIDAIGGEGTIDYDNIKRGSSQEDFESNARYAISMGRKIGARIYALPDDLWEVNYKMVLTIFACLMSLAFQKGEGAQD